MRDQALAAIGCHLLPKQFKATENAGQQVVEVMRDTAGKLPQGFHLLRLVQLGFQPAAFGDVAGTAQNAGDCPALSRNGM